MTSGTSTADVNTSASVDPVGKPPMVMRSIRVPLKLWEQAKAKADAEEKDISQVVRDLLERYVGARRADHPDYDEEWKP